MGFITSILGGAPKAPKAPKIELPPAPDLRAPTEFKVPEFNAPTINIPEISLPEYVPSNIKVDPVAPGPEPLETKISDRTDIDDLKAINPNATSNPGRRSKRKQGAQVGQGGNTTGLFLPI